MIEQGAVGDMEAARRSVRGLRTLQWGADGAAQFLPLGTGATWERALQDELDPPP